MGPGRRVSSNQPPLSPPPPTIMFESDSIYVRMYIQLAGSLTLHRASYIMYVFVDGLWRFNDPRSSRSINDPLHTIQYARHLHNYFEP